jgi:fatty-acyl-CoA synthase
MTAFVRKTIGQLVEETASAYPDRPALIFPEFGIRQDYRAFYTSCREVAKGLLALGIQRGDHVAVWTTNLPSGSISRFSLGMVGGVLVTVNTNYQSHELEYILRQSDATTLFIMESIGISISTPPPARSSPNWISRNQGASSRKNCPF